MNHKKRRNKPLVDEEDVEDMDIEDIDMNAVTDSEEEYTESERKLLEKVRKGRTTENFDSDDEVYGLQDNSEEEDREDDQQDSMESDIERLQEDDDIPDDRAWGKKWKNYYSSDFKYTGYGTQKDLDNAEMEKQEANRLQTRLTDESFDIISNRFRQTKDDRKDDQKDNEQSIEFNKLNKSQQQELKQKEYMMFMALITDFKECMMEVKDILDPFLKLVNNGTCPDSDAVTLLRTKYHIILNYCVNISFYLMLKAKNSTPVTIQSHPVIKRLEQYRQLLTQLQSAQGDLLKQVVEIVKAVKEGKPLYSISDDSQRLSKVKVLGLANLNKKLARRKETVIQNKKERLLSNNVDMDSADEKEYTDEENLNIKEEYNDEDKEEKDNILDATNEGEGKRAITYQIAKNRGLTPYRKKELRNPRVKHRNKYRKAKIRRKGAVREVRREVNRYAGEISGIKAGVKKGIKLK